MGATTVQDIPVLERAGLSKNERAIYLSLLSGGGTVNVLSKKTRLQRSYLYDILEHLLDLGLVSVVTKNKKKHYTAGRPEQLLDVVKRKEQQLSDDAKELERVIPTLNKLKREQQTTGMQDVQLHTGTQGIRAVLEDILFTKKKFIAFGAEGRFKELYTWYFDNWQRRRTTAKISYRILYDEHLKGSRPSPTQKLVTARFIPSHLVLPMTIIVYGTKTALITWEKEPLAIILTNIVTAKKWAAHFETIWKHARS